MVVLFHADQVRRAPIFSPAVGLEVPQKERIRRALGAPPNRIPRVDGDTLRRYYRFLASKMALPFRAHYPEPATAREEGEFGCTVLSLYDPAGPLGDEFDGIFCKVGKRGCDVDLPLIELRVPSNCPNCQLIEDYWYWFWNWR